MSDIKYILLKNEKIIFSKTISEIAEECDMSISSVRRRREFSNKIKDNIYLYNNIDPLTNYDKKNIFYLLVANDLSQFSFYTSLKNVAQKNSFDYSSLCKLLKNKSYKSIGGYNKGRKNNDCNQKGYNIYIVNKGKIPGEDEKLEIIEKDLQYSDENILEKTDIVEDIIEDQTISTEVNNLSNVETTI